MPRKRTTGFTEREIEILTILWDAGEASVEDIRTKLTGTPTGSTVRTLLSVMVDRGFVVDNGKGYAKLYRACIDRLEGQRSALQKFIDTVFSGSTDALLLRLMDNEDVDLDRLKALQARLESSEDNE